mmetsp:Transcript_266/g.950  ORF Transcript_266/g.950 Transcript_266/m.950 type:complete len:797 (+) Transcript_266:107-2497(+)
MSDERKPLMPKKAAPAPKPFKATATPSWALLLNPLAWLLWTLDFLLWFILFGWVKTLGFYCKGPYSVETATATRRSKAAVGGLCMTAVPGQEISNVAVLLDYICEKYKDEQVMGTRTFLGEHKPEGARFPLKKFGETTWITYGELRTRALSFGAALVSDKIGMESMPKGISLENAKASHVLLIYEDTSAEWLTAALGAMAYSLAIATSYATLGIASVGEAINESGVRVVLTNRRSVDKVGGLRAQCPSLATIIYTDLNVEPAVAAGAPPQISGGGMFATSLKLLGFEDAIALGGALGDARKAAPGADASTTAVVMYTSGSTGKPKGVVLDHQCICSTVGGIGSVLGTMTADDVGACYLAYLPLAHILEFCAELTILGRGGKLGYADPRTLSSSGACREQPDGVVHAKAGYPYPPGAIQEFRPAYMAGVPKIWDILKKGFEDTLSHASPVAQMVFNIAFVARAVALRQHRDTPLFNKLVFSKFAAGLGGNLRCTISGGGPISSEVQTFVRTAFVCPCVQGYALTETTASATIQIPDNGNFDGVAGSPIISAETRLVSCDITDSEGKKYLSTDTMHLGQPCCGRGEIHIRGPTVAKGYYKQPEKTAEVFLEGGWFASGDVGIWRPDGQLKIVDRVKNLIKTKGGEYIAIESMESVYATSSYISGVNGGILCYGDGDMDKPVAFVCVDEKKLTAWASANGVAYETFPALCKAPEAVKEVLASLDAAGKAGKLGANELLLGVVLLPGTGSPTNSPPLFDDPWTPENGMLTASNKLQRKQILAAYGANGVFDALKAQGIKN